MSDKQTQQSIKSILEALEKEVIKESEMAFKLKDTNKGVPPMVEVEGSSFTLTQGNSSIVLRPVQIADLLKKANSYINYRSKQKQFETLKRKK